MKKLSFLLLALLVMACNDGNSLTTTKESAPLVDLSYSNDGLEETVVETNSVSGEPTTTLKKQIIKNARLVFEADNPEKMRQQIVSLTRSSQGFIQNDVSGKSYNRLYWNITLRVPTTNFNDFLAALSKDVSHFDTKDISRKDVSEEFVDLNARLKTKKELEKRYLDLLKQAKNVREMLDIERELSNIREEIEAKQGRLNYLQDQVAMSTVYIEFYTYTSETTATTSYWQKMKNAFTGGWDGISVFFIGILYLWPFWLVVIILFFAIRRYLKRKKKN